MAMGYVSLRFVRGHELGLEARHVFRSVVLSQG